MSQPRFPDNSNANINREGAINQILSSIAYEELALSHIINSEGEKIQYVLGTLEGVPAPNTSIEDVLNINKSVRDTLQMVANNQMFLNQKMSMALDTSTTPSNGSNNDDKETQNKNTDLNYIVGVDVCENNLELTTIDNTNYTLTVPYQIEELTVFPSLVDSKAIVSGDIGNKKLAVGKNLFTLTVTAEDKTTTKTYSITIIREANSNLEDLSVAGFTLDPIFYKAIKNYTIQVPKETTNIEVTAKTTDSNAAISGSISGMNMVTKVLALANTNNVVSITVTATDGTTKDYFINIKRGT